MLTGCGRVGFDALVGDRPDDSGVVPFDIAFNVPLACIPASTSPNCTTDGGVTAMSASTFHTCAIRAGGISCWGENMTGALGFCADTQQVLVPTQTFAFPAAQIAVGELHTCARLVDGQVWCWGSRFQGETGDGISQEWSPIPRRIPGQFRDLATRRYHTCAVDTAGALWCWGNNREGALGLGDLVDRGTPQRVGTSNAWSRVAVGGGFTCALDSADETYCWGDNTNGAVGDGTRMMRTTPTKIGLKLKSVSAGKEHVCGNDAAGRAWCWGRGVEGELGNNKVGPPATSEVPFLVGAYAPIVAAWFYTCGLDANGALFCWGDNAQRTISPMNQDTFSTPLAIAAGPFVEIAAGGYQTCVRDAAGRVSCYGLNAQGQVGVGDRVLRQTLQPLCF